SKLNRSEPPVAHLDDVTYLGIYLGSSSAQPREPPASRKMMWSLEALDGAEPGPSQWKRSHRARAETPGVTTVKRGGVRAFAGEAPRLEVAVRWIAAMFVPSSCARLPPAWRSRDSFSPMVDRSGYALRPNGGREILFRGTRMHVKVGYAEGTAYSLIEMAHAPNVGPALHRHPGGDEAFYILDGEYEIR